MNIAALRAASTRAVASSCIAQLAPGNYHAFAASAVIQLSYREKSPDQHTRFATAALKALLPLLSGTLLEDAINAIEQDAKIEASA